MKDGGEESIEIFLEFVTDTVREEYTETGTFEPRVALIHKNRQGQFLLSFMSIPSVYVLDGKKGSKGWESLQRRMGRFVTEKRMEGSEVIVLYHAVDSRFTQDYDDGRIVIVTKTGASLENVVEKHYMAEEGRMTVDDSGELGDGWVRLREIEAGG